MKKFILTISFLSYLFFLLYKNFLVYEFCGQTSLSPCSFSMDSVSAIFNFAGIVALFGILLYRQQDIIYKAWWSFARWSIPLVLFIIFIINLELHHTPGGWFNMDATIDRFVVSVLYGLFVIGSLMQIYRGYRGGVKNVGK